MQIKKIIKNKAIKIILKHKNQIKNIPISQKNS